MRQRIHFLIDKSGTICYISTFRIITSQYILNQSQVYTMRKLTIRRSQMTDIYQTFQFRKWMIQCYLSVLLHKMLYVCINTTVKCKWKQLTFCFEYVDVMCGVFCQHVNTWGRCLIAVHFWPSSYVLDFLDIFNFFFEFLNLLWQFWSNFRNKMVIRKKVLS